MNALALALFCLFPQPLQAADLEVVIFKPSTLDAVFGSVEVEAEVHAPEPVIRVELYVDGKRAGVLKEAPYRWQIDVGQRNVEHQFEVLAYGESGLTGSSMVMTPRIHIDEQVEVELQQLYVTASNQGKRVLDISDREFQVLDDGQNQNIITFARGDLPLAAMLLIDSSESMRGERFQAALRGAEAFVQGIRSLDEVSLLLFSDQILHATPFTSDAAVLLDPLEGIQATGNTSINDHLYLALNQLGTRQGRRVVVLFTDGADLHSVLEMKDVLWKARRSRALIYWIQLQEDEGSRASFSTAWRDADGNDRELEMLQQAVEQSGGRIAVITRIDAIEEAFREILAELREQYVLGYYPSQVRNDGSWHAVKVRVDRPGIKIRTTGGYVDF